MSKMVPLEEAARLVPGLVATACRIPRVLDPASDERTVHDWLTINEAADFLRCTPQTIHRMLAAGRLRGYRVVGGNRVLIHRSDVVSCLEPIQSATYEGE